jgi:DNA polymerase I
MVFYLIDGTAICYRAYYAYATKNLHNSKGMPTNVPYGFLLVLRKILADNRPDGIMVAFDVKGPTFRHDKLDTYKANRKPTPDDLIAQIPYVKRLVEAHRIPVVELEGYEADDVMGTLAHRLRKKGHEVVIVTSDKDICQLVTDHVRVMDPGKEYALLGPMEVREKLGVAPDQVIDYLAMVGDASDNIPGVPGIGPKTAVELIREFESLDGVYRNLDKIKGEAKKKALAENESTARLAQELATIHCDVPIAATEDDLKRRDPDPAMLKEIYQELEFKSFLKELPHPTVQESADKRYHLVTKDKEWKQLLAQLKKTSRFSLDFETTGIDALTVKPVGLSFSFQSHEAYFVLFDIHVSGLSELAAADVLADLKPILEDPDVKKIGQNIKYEMMVLGAHGIELRGEDFDTMVASYLLNPSKSNHNLSELALEHLDERLVEIESLIGTGKKQITMAEADVEQLYRYGCQDSDVVWRLAGILEPRIREAGMADLFEKIEMPLVRVLCDMEAAGIAIDVKFLHEFSARMEKEIEALTKKIHKLAGGEFNINSPKQLGEILFEKLKLPHDQNRLHDRRRRARRARGAARPPGADPRLPGAGEAQIDLCRPDAGAAQPERPSHPHVVQPDGHRHRSPLVERPQLAEHSDPDRRRPGGAPRVRGAQGPRAVVGRLFADRAPDPGPPVGRSKPVPRICRESGRARVHREPRVRRGPGGRVAPDA